MPMDEFGTPESGKRIDTHGEAKRWWNRLPAWATQQHITDLVNRSTQTLAKLRSVPQRVGWTAEERRARLLIASGVIAAMGIAAFGGGEVDHATPGRSELNVLAHSDDADRDRASRASRFLDRGVLSKPSPRQPRPTAGYGPVQMENARLIVEAGQEMGVPRRAMVIAVATAMQESNLLNRANEWVPESKNYDHQGTGWDHDSVGLFQQRPSTGWGAVKDLMDPKYAAKQFYKALLQVPGWEEMALTDAAQRVQVSAFPFHYAKHEGNAEAVVSEILAAQQGEP